MLKKLFILLLIAGVVGVATFPLWMSKLTDEAFAHPERKNSAEKVKDSMLLKVKLQQYKEARKIAEKAIIYFPESEEFPYFLANAAKCAEEERRHDVAIFWYSKFLKQYPDHIWSKQIKNKLTRLKELYQPEKQR